MAFTQVQNGAAITGSTSGSVTTLTLTLPAPSTAGTLLVACMVTGQAGRPLKITAVGPGGGPNTSPGWEWCGTSVNGSGGGGQQVEVWCYRQNPGGVTSATWSLPTGDGARGHMMEFSSTLAWQVMELFPGLNNSVQPGDTSFPVAMGNPVGTGELAVAMFGDNFTVSTALTWTTPSGWTLGRSTTTGGTIMMHWASYYQTTAAAGAVSVTGTASTAASQIGWEAAVVVFREAAAVASRVGGSCSATTYNDQASFGLPATKAGSAAEADIFIGRTMFQSAQVSYQKEGAHLTGPPVHGGTGGDLVDLTNMGAQILWSMKPNRTGASGFTTVAAEQAAVDQDLTYVKQAGITGFLASLYNEYQLGGQNGPFGNDTYANGSDPYGSGNTYDSARKHYLTYWGNYQPILAAHGVPAYAKPAFSSFVSTVTWLPPAGTISGVMVDNYASEGINQQKYIDASPGTDPDTGNPAPSLTDVCDGVKNPDGSAASNIPIPLGIGETGRAGSGSSANPWSAVVSWSHTAGGAGHLRDLFAARLAAGKQNAPIIWFENNLGSGNWIHTPGANGEDQSGIQAELAAWVDNLTAAAPPPVTVTTTSLPPAALGVAYRQTLHVSGGSAPYTWALATGSLNAGLALSAAGVISGTPTTGGTSSFTVTVTDAGSNTGTSGTLSITVPGISVTTTSLPAVSLGVPYTQTLAEQGGTGPFTWSISADSVLPAGITLSSAGVLAGTTGDVPGPYAFTAIVTDSLANTATAALTLTVSAGATGGGTPVQLPPGFPQVIIEAGFYAPSPVAQPAALILDDPVNGLLDSGQLSDGTAWTDITAYVRSGTITRSSTRVQGPLRTYQAGTASVTLDNADGRFDPSNISPTAPYVTGTTSSIRAMLPVRIRAIYGNVEYHLFAGFIDTWTTPDTNWGARYAEITASATDGFKVLAGITLPAMAAIGSGQPAGSRINKILTDAGWFTDHRRIDTGDSELQATTYGDTVLNLIQLAADTEIGELYVDGAGNLTFRERQAILSDTRSTTPQAAFTDPPGYSALTTDSMGFEASAGTWTAAGNCAIARSTAAFHTGAAALRLTSTAAGDMTAAHCTAAAITTQGLPVSPGQQVPCSAWLLAAASPRSCQAGAQFYDITGTVVGNIRYGPAVTDSTSAWTQATALITAPATAAYCRLSVLVQAAGGASEIHYIDDAALHIPGLAYVAVGRADDDTTLANDVQITAAGSPNMQEAADATSIAKYLFPRSYSRADVILQSDAEALAYAQWVLYVSLAGENRFDTLTVTPLRDPGLWPQVLGREIGDRITILRDPPGMGPISKDVFIRGITHTVDVSSNTWQTQWDLDDASRYSGFVILDDTILGRVSKGNLIAY